MTIAVAGNPNSGKTPIFNALTGSRQHVGNYPGVTVERKAGFLRHGGRVIQVVDLPGTYSLTAYSAEERVARSFLLEDRPDMVVDVVDASNLQRNLYLAVQFIELGVPLIVALNMSDVAEARGCAIDVESLAASLGVPVVATVGHKGQGIEELTSAIIGMVEAGVVPRHVSFSFDPAIEREVAGIVSVLDRELAAGDAPPQHHCHECGGCSGQLPVVTTGARPSARWLALKLLEHDDEARRKMEQLAVHPELVLAAVESAAHRIEKGFGDAAAMVIAHQRYAVIAHICEEAVNTTVGPHRHLSDRIDGIVTNRLLGIPIFLGLMYLVFKLTFTLGRLPVEWLERGFGWLGETIGALWPAGSASALESLIVDGVLGGVGGVLVFLPNILLLFLAISLLEDSGYMARAAFITDRLMQKIGLHGKSFIPMLIGFGCTVPAILATRVLENRRDRLTTMLVLPLVSCGARLPIYTLLVPAFFPAPWQAPVLWSIYLIGIVLAVLLARVLRWTVFQGDAAPFVMELPPYRMPTLRDTLIHVGQRGCQFVWKAGTIVLGISIVLWAMNTYPRPPQSRLAGLNENQARNVRLSFSLSGRVGRAIEPVMRPIGFDWKTSTALVGAVAAKEVFVSQLGIVHSLGATDEQSESLRDVLRREYTPLQAFCIMLFCLVSLPCAATLAAIWRESGSWKWAAAELVGLTLLAYLLTFVVYQVGAALGLSHP